MNEIEYVKCKNEFTYKGRQFNNYTTFEHLEESCKFQFLPTDIVISTFSRSGTTFTQEIVWQIKNRKTVTKGEKVDSTMARFPFLEFNYKFFPDFSKSFIEVLNSQREDPYRLIKTHVPFEFIKENFDKVNPKMIVVMRNAKDCLVSNYYLHKEPILEWNGNFNDFFTIFLNEKTFTGSYFDNNLEWWSLRDRDNVLFLFYEDLILDLKQNVEKIANFLGEKLSENEMDKILYNSSFSMMKNNPNINVSLGGPCNFIRKGMIGGWKNYFTKEQSEILDEKIAKKFKGSGLKFIYG